MSELEALGNKELRAKCQEYGLPDVPVTDSSCKVLIRRLEAAMAKPKSNRRETMHVSKPSEIASSSKKTINNNTTNTTTTTSTTTTNKSTPAANRPSRRTIVVPERHVVTTTTVSEPEYSDVSPDRGEDKTIVMPKAKTPEKSASLYPKLPTKEPSPKPQMLSKTGVVTTSFVLETKPMTGINTSYAAPDEIDSSEEDIREQVMKHKTPPPLKTYAPLSDSQLTTSNPLTASLSSSTRYSPLRSTGVLSYNTNQPTSYTSSMTTSSNSRKTYAAPITTTTTTYGQYNRVAAPASSKYVEYEDADIDYEDDEDYDDDDVVVVEDSFEGKDIQTPFLSQFARNLENIKATPLRHPVAPTRLTPPTTASLRNRETAAAYSRRTVGYTGNIAPRRSLQNQDDTMSQFRQVMTTMEEKYHLKTIIIIMAIFISVVFLYVFFIQSV